MKTRNIILTSLLMAVPIIAQAQDNTWERIEREPTEAQNPDARYLKPDAVPMEEGRVVFRTTIEAPDKSAQELYSIAERQLEHMCKEENQMGNSLVALKDQSKGMIGAIYHEWLVFKNTALSLDQTVMNYQIMVTCNDGKAEVVMTRITYDYELERNPQHYTAEEWITDEYAVNKKHTKLLPLSAKFRRKTIDRKDYIFKKFSTLFNEK